MLKPGSILKERRQQLGASIEKVSQETKIQPKFIEYLENDQYDKFSSTVFASGFLKNYSDYLSLDTAKIQALFRRSITDNKSIEKKNKKSKFKFDFKLSSANIIYILIGIFILSLLGYIYFQFYSFIRPPSLRIDQPQNNSVVTDQNIDIKGQTDKNSKLEVNNKNVQISDKGSFNVTISLTNGKNNITVKSVNPNNKNRSTLKIINVEYSPNGIDSQNLTSTSSSSAQSSIFNVQLDIVEQDTWIQLILDNKQVEAGILTAPYTNNYTFNNKLEIHTGKPSDTKLLINGQEYSLTINHDTGTASLICNINNSLIKCN